MREHIVMAPRGWIIGVRFFQGDTEIVQRYDVDHCRSDLHELKQDG
jgi:hypothetical protein